MDKKYLAKIIASDNEGLQMISACSAGAKVKVSDIKYLASNKVFLLSIERTKSSFFWSIFLDFTLSTKSNLQILLIFLSS